MGRNYEMSISTKLENILAGLAAQKGTTKADIIRRAILTYEYLMREAGDESRNQVSITLRGRVLKNVVLP